MPDTDSTIEPGAEWRHASAASPAGGLGSGDAQGGEVVEISVPADPRYIRIVRLTTSGMAALAGFDVESIDDIKIAVGEVCATLIEVGDGSPLRVRLTPVDAHGVEVEAEVPLARSVVIDETRFSLSRRILAVIADHHDFQLTDDRARFVLSMSATPAPDAP